MQEKKIIYSRKYVFVKNFVVKKKSLTNRSVYDIINTLMPEPRIWETGFLMKSGFTRPVWDLRLCKYFKR